MLGIHHRENEGEQLGVVGCASVFQYQRESESLFDFVNGFFNVDEIIKTNNSKKIDEENFSSTTTESNNSCSEEESLTADLAGSSSVDIEGSFWLASMAVGVGGGGGAQTSSTSTHAVVHPTNVAMDGLGSHHHTQQQLTSIGSVETGFISSQPTMAECMTALTPMVNDNSINQLSPGTMASVNNNNNNEPISPGSTGYHTTLMDPHATVVLQHQQQTQIDNGLNVNVAEYAWMKEKKTTRKNSQLGKLTV